MCVDTLRHGLNESGQVRCIIIDNFASKFFECLWLIDRRHCDPNNFDFQLASKNESTDRHTNQFWFAFETTLWHASTILIHSSKWYFSHKQIALTQIQPCCHNNNKNNRRKRNIETKKKPHTVLYKLVYQHETKSTLQFCYFLFHFVSTISIFFNFVLITHAWQWTTQHTRTTKSTAAKLFDECIDTSRNPAVRNRPR